MRRVLAVFVCAAISVAALGVLTRSASDVAPAADWVTYHEPALGWTMEIPNDWRVQPYLRLCGYQFRGTLISNVHRTFPPARIPRGCTSGHDFRVGGPTLVAVEVGTVASEPGFDVSRPPDTPLPLDPATFTASARMFSRGVVVDGGPYHVSIYHHPRATPRDLATAWEIVRSIAWHPRRAEGTP